MSSDVTPASLSTAPAAAPFDLPSAPLQATAAAPSNRAGSRCGLMVCVDFTRQSRKRVGGHDRLQPGECQPGLVAGLDQVGFRLREVHLRVEEVEDGAGAGAITQLLHPVRFPGDGDPTRASSAAARSAS